MQKESIDLMNIEYDDVLHLYRGWRRSESALKDKNKELNNLKNRVTQLHESHDQFRSQINALESVKELTVTLQNQLTSLQQTNKQLVEENHELADLSMKAESLLKDKVNIEKRQEVMIKDIQLEFATLRGRYDETLKAQRELEQLASDEQAMRIAAETRLNAADETLSSMKEENRVLRQKLDSSTLRLNQCDQELLHASEHLNNLSAEVSNIAATKHQLSSVEAEIGVLKGDISRLLRLMEHSPATKDFLAHWLDSGGMDFVGIAPRDSNSTATLSRLGASLSGPSYALDRNDEATAAIETILSSAELTPAEFSHLKRVHGGDPFPMTANLVEEGEYWVPSEAARLGLQFISAKAPHASPSVIMEFLRSMNKIWLKRERRRVKRVKQVYAGKIEDLKRQLANAKPYKGVIAERQIRLLKSQVLDQRSKGLTGRARRALEQGPYDLATFEEADQNDEDERGHLPLSERRPCKVAQRASQHQAASVALVSTEKLLAASLNSLESMGRKLHMSATGGGGGGSVGASLNMSLYPGDDGDDDNQYGVGGLSHSRDSSAMLHLHNRSSGGGLPGSDGQYPNETYLRGALWLGRNLTMVSEDLADAMDAFRTKYLGEVTAASQDTDSRRSAYRLALLASSGVNEAHGLASKSRLRTREILQGASAIAPGDRVAYNAFMQTLPIESALAASMGGAQDRSFNQSRASSPGHRHESLRRSKETL